MRKKFNLEAFRLLRNFHSAINFEFALAQSVSAAKSLLVLKSEHVFSWNQPQESSLSAAFKLQIIQTRAREDYSAKHRWHQRAGALQQPGLVCANTGGPRSCHFLRGAFMKRLASCSLRYTHTAVNKSKLSCKSKKNWQRVLFDDVNTRVCMRRHIMGSDPVRANPCDKVSVSRSLSVPYSFYICDMPSVALPCIMGLQMRPAFTQSHFLLHWLCQTPTTAAPARWVGGETRI